MNRLICALDVPLISKAKELVEHLGDTVEVYKVGMELFVQRGCWTFIDWLLGQNKQVFLDLKLFDIPRTVAATISQISSSGISYVTVHGNDSIIQAAIDALPRDSPLKILAVTCLISLS